MADESNTTQTSGSAPFEGDPSVVQNQVDEEDQANAATDHEQLPSFSEDQAAFDGTEDFEADDDLTQANPNIIDLPSEIATETPSEQERARVRRRVIFVRNPESVESAFPDWMKRAFITGKYRPFDQNLPLMLPERSGASFVFGVDSPLTELGSMMARLIGRQLRAERNLVLMSSPALRCVQTAKELALEMANTSDFDAPAPICVEPAIFDFVTNYKFLPCWMRASELASEGYEINQKYAAFDPNETCAHRDGETLKQYRNRCQNTILNVLDRWPGHGDIVLVTHPVTIDCMLRGLLGKLPPTKDLDKTYPCGSVIVLEQSDEDRTWSRVNDAITPITCAGFSSSKVEE